MQYRVPLKHEATGQHRDVIVALTPFQKIDASRQRHCSGCVGRAYALRAAEQQAAGFTWDGSEIETVH